MTKEVFKITKKERRDNQDSQPNIKLSLIQKILLKINYKPRKFPQIPDKAKTVLQILSYLVFGFIWVWVGFADSETWKEFAIFFTLLLFLTIKILFPKFNFRIIINCYIALVLLAGIIEKHDNHDAIVSGFLM